MRKLLAGLCVLAAMVFVFWPSVRYTEDRDTVLLARVIYALGRDESYEAKLMLGSVAMNRMESAQFGNSLGEVLREQQQFPAGSRYDDESLRAAHALLSGERALPKNALYYRSSDAPDPYCTAIASCEGYLFYAKKGLL